MTDELVVPVFFAVAAAILAAMTLALAMELRMRSRREQGLRSQLAAEQWDAERVSREAGEEHDRLRGLVEGLEARAQRQQAELAQAQAQIGSLSAELIPLKALAPAIRQTDLWHKISRSGQPPALDGENLRGLDLSAVNLSHAQLRDADLQGARLEAGSLYHADLSGANLQGADLRQANLCGAVLCGANLDRADVREADLYAADLTGASVRGAAFDGATYRSHGDDQTRWPEGFDPVAAGAVRVDGSR